MERRVKKRLSKALALLLRHKAERHKITVEPGTGWADIDEILRALKKKSGRRFLRRHLVDAAIAGPDGKVRFQVEGNRIRALYGHSQVEVSYPEEAPPERLYHGTSPDAAEVILAEGIRGMARQYVHLAAKPDYARQVGGRHSPTPVVLVVRAAEAAAEGVAFHCPDGLHWLAKEVPARYLQREEDAS
jgi:putative RNA 2'-phosphotransferase